MTEVSFPIVDMHVHLVGSGDDAGDARRLSWWRWPLMAYMLKHIGLSVWAGAKDFSQRYATNLRRLIRESSLERVVLLAHDHVHDHKGRALEHLDTFYVPNDHVLSLAREHREFIPAVSIHPARLDALVELDRCLVAGARMLKFLPNCHNIDCNLPQYKPFWERMAEQRLPLLAHTGGEHTVRQVRPDLADPRTLRGPLECGVTVIAAHCASKSGLLDPQYFGIFLDMLKRYPHLYGDLSALNLPIRSRVIPYTLSSAVVGRLVHGSDFPVPVQPLWAWLRGLISRATYVQARGQRNVLERDYQLKRAMGFPPETFTRINQLLRPVEERAAHLFQH